LFLDRGDLNLLNLDLSIRQNLLLWELFHWSYFLFFLCFLLLLC